MKIKIVLCLVLFALTSCSNSQPQRIGSRESYGSLSYIVPKGWTSSKHLKVNGKESYGCHYAEKGKAVQFSVIELKNDSEHSSIKTIIHEDLENLIKGLFHPESKFENTGNRTLDNNNFLYSKAIAVASKNRKVTSLNYLTINKSKIIIIQGIYPSIYEKQFKPIFDKIFYSIKMN